MCKKLIQKLLAAVCISAFMLLNSCLGVSADISINADGSGKITLEYRVSQMLESTGRLDGNESRPAIPAGRVDFERSVARIPGLRLSSYSAQNVSNASGGSDLVTKAVLQFTTTDALLAFLDSTGSHAALVRNNGNHLRLTFMDPAAGMEDAELLSLMREIFAGYEMCISLTAPSDARLSLIPSIPAARLVSNGKKVSAAIDMGDLVTHNGGLALEIEW